MKRGHTQLEKRNPKRRQPIACYTHAVTASVPPAPSLLLLLPPPSIPSQLKITVLSKASNNNSTPGHRLYIYTDPDRHPQNQNIALCSQQESPPQLNFPGLWKSTKEEQRHAWCEEKQRGEEEAEDEGEREREGGRRGVGGARGEPGE